MKALVLALGLLLVSTSAGAGKVNGPGWDKDILAAGQTINYTRNNLFRGREEAIVTVSGDGDGDIDCYVYDENSNLVVSDSDSLDNCFLRWTPLWTGVFRVRVVNHGTKTTVFTMETN